MIKKCCIFVDGENFRHAIVDLFDNFNQADYLPKMAKWDQFFDWLVAQVIPRDFIGERVRTYWYVVQHIDFFPYHIPGDQEGLKNLLKKNNDWKESLANLCGDELTAKINEYKEELIKRKASMRKRSDGWSEIQDSICMRHSSIEFRKEGAIRYDLFTRSLGKEKAVDVKLAVDMITLQNIYDIAIIVSGDQDYTPAVRKLKDCGKKIVNVAFSNRGGKLLPGGARRLNNVTDDRITVTYDQLRGYMGF